MSTTQLPVRADDPDTSYAAAIRATMGASKIRPVILDILRQADEPMTHDEIIAAYRFRIVTTPDTPRASDSGVRTRLKELVAAGLVYKAPGLGKSAYGNAAVLWMAVDDDVVIAAAHQVAADADGLEPEEADDAEEDDS